MKLLRVIVFAVPALLAGCRDSTGLVVCTLESRSSLSVLIRDAVTDEFIGSGATLVLRDGAFADSASWPAEPYYDALPLTTDNSYERAGVYSVTVRRAGYLDWQRDGVEVTEDRCHVRSVSLTVRLTPLMAQNTP